MTDQELLSRAAAYAAGHNLHLAERLGFGIHGMVFVAESNLEGGRTPVKAHREEPPFLRELEAYDILAAEAVTRIRGFNVPQLIAADTHLRIVEMSIVTRPFVLDFAGAYLNPPQFDEDIWANWEAEKREQFGHQWPKVQIVLSELKRFGIHMIDVSPSNIAFEAPPPGIKERW